MSLLRRFKATDLFEFNNVNLDVLTETYNISFYLQYLARWPDLFSVQISPHDNLMGYVMGKAEGTGQNWHGHVTAITVAPEYRRLGLADGMMNLLEQVSEKTYNGWFVDLYVRVSNAVAVGMYKKFGYSVYRRVRGYYGGSHDSEDAYDMRKPLARDTKKETIRDNGENVYVNPEELDSWR
ncbi:acyl-CoA N-acyltransferase [Halteromyces radiatus]|uniref:acyl-CoA N-acyltransferase n=1 Tax=Halteromyces radiatus TaxID=101107 RepID=UPI0022206C5F|nr:acyl-CoA N-acyltransferase [Halteromyces radiatus]KAI8097596.1 acyl-CoA N-acyltransferase [Halteromyces radiatus]